MRVTAQIGLLLCGLLLLCAPSGHANEPVPAEVTLTRRIDNGAYGTAAYSFRLASQDPAVHRNYVDLVFSGCGQMHINPVSGMSSRIVDCGSVPFGPQAPAAPADDDARWHQRSIRPQAGHVYLQAIKDERQSFAVAFIVTEIGLDKIKLRWQPVDSTHQVLPLPDGKGAAGTMGQCGGAHPEK